MRWPSSSAAAPPPRNRASPTPAWSRPATSPPGPRPGMSGKVLRSLLAAWRGASSLAAVVAGSGLHGALAARLQARDLPGQPLADAAPGASTAATGCTRSPRPANSSTSAATATWCCCAPSGRKSWCRPGCDVLRAAGTSFREIDADEARKIEPALSTDTALRRRHPPAGRRGRQLPAVRPAAQVGGRGARRPFHFNCDLAPIERGRPRPLLVWGLRRVGSEAASLRRRGGLRRRRLGSAAGPLGLHIPLAPVYGHSVSAPIREPLNAPRSAVMDERYKVAISRLGLRVRVAGSAELGGSPGHKQSGLAANALQGAAGLVPGRGDAAGAGVQQWKGARPMLPDGPPILGASGIPGVWLNLGHGSSGWALSCGSARVVADLMAGQEPGVDLEGLGVERLLRAEASRAAGMTKAITHPPRAWQHCSTSRHAQIEQAARPRLPPHTLMQRAGLAVARLAWRSHRRHARIWIACGPGNNGGDGMEAAPHCARGGKQWWSSGRRRSTLPADARAALARARAEPGHVHADAPPAHATWRSSAARHRRTRAPDGEWRAGRRQ